MIWSCEINYSGWEDDIHHHHFFIDKETKPTEDEVAQHYNWAIFHNEDEYDRNWLRKATKNERVSIADSDYVALDSKGMVRYWLVHIIIEPLKVEKLNET